MDYEHAVYCWCGLKAPLCVGRESGRTIYDYQKWKVGGCGFFLCKEEVGIKEIVRDEEMKELVMAEEKSESADELKKLVEGLVLQISHVQSDVACVKTVIDNEAKVNKKSRKLYGLAMIVLLGLVGSVYLRM
ncbi:unnamed protein product [Cuscuta europaea]|uniref:Uncharacterized protein n=1 Tax=Cuscuta europaea TaxID=41803 RepID=A0A9P0YPI0_CUSEU|nr:unnamed protein product [Cuscuta europaea]